MWLDSKIDVFLEELAASGMHLDRQRAGELITGQVRAVATLMRVTEATARTYLDDDEIIKDMAWRMLFQVAGERPGADLMEAPRTVPLPLNRRLGAARTRCRDNGSWRPDRRCAHRPQPAAVAEHGRNAEAWSSLSPNRRGCRSRLMRCAPASRTSSSDRPWTAARTGGPFRLAVRV